MDKININQRAEDFFLDFINFLEGIKSHCKAMHWGINNIDIKSKRGAHIYLDDFLDKISNYQDMIAETTQGILGNYITISNIRGKYITSEVSTPNLLCEFLLKNIYIFYKGLKEEKYIGIKSETETFIKDIQQFNYLFNLCN